MRSVEALELEMLYDFLSVINVRFAGYRCCSTDLRKVNTALCAVFGANDR